MKPIHEAIELAIGEAIVKNPNMNREDILSCFSLCLDAVQPTIMDYTVQLESFRQESNRLDREIAEMNRRFSALFHQLQANPHVN
jgi:hypothetical protein